MEQLNLTRMADKIEFIEDYVEWSLERTSRKPGERESRLALTDIHKHMMSTIVQPEVGEVISISDKLLLRVIRKYYLTRKYVNKTFVLSAKLVT